ncbi:MAG: tetratricopeptide (TPR) repeat protein, partial [Planctomycetota bacterium]
EQRAGPAQAQALSQTEIAAILTRLARLRKQMGEENMALELLDQALEAQPDLEEALKLKEQW